MLYRLIYLVISFLITTTSFSTELPTDFRSPKLEIITKFQCAKSGSDDWQDLSVSGDQLVGDAMAQACFSAKYSTPPSCSELVDYSVAAPSREHDSVSPFGMAVYYECTYTSNISGETKTRGFSVGVNIRSAEVGESLTCPSDDPLDAEYINGQDTDDDGKIDVCLKDYDPDKCPDGNFQFAINVNGEKKCVPINCPDKGTQKSIWANSPTSNPGAQYNNTAGTYCDGQCSYSVDGGQGAGSGMSAISGVSTGSVCGSGSGGYHAEGQDASDCSVSQISGGGTFMSCSIGGEPDGGEPSDGSETGEEPKVLEELEELKESPPLIPSDNNQTCSPDDLNCNFSNLQNSIRAGHESQVNQEASLFNAQLDATKKTVENDNRLNTELSSVISSSSTVNAMGLQIISEEIQKTNQLIAGLGDSGASNGSGSGGNGDGDGDSLIELKQAPSDGLSGFYTPEYPDGLGDVISEFQANVKNTEIYNSIEKWDVEITGGHAALMNMCFDLGSMGNYGCHDIKIDSRVFPFIRIIMILGALLLARKLTLGG